MVHGHERLIAEHNHDCVASLGQRTDAGCDRGWLAPRIIGVEDAEPRQIGKPVRDILGAITG